MFEISVDSIGFMIPFVYSWKSGLGVNLLDNMASLFPLTAANYTIEWGYKVAPNAMHHKLFEMSIGKKRR